jgi:hypothetical protein
MRADECFTKIISPAKFSAKEAARRAAKEQAMAKAKAEAEAEAEALLQREAVALRYAESDATQPIRSPLQPTSGDWRRHFTVKAPTGKAIKVEHGYDQRLTVGEVKMKIQDAEGIPSELMRLLFAGQVLANERPIMEYNIEFGQTLHLGLALPPALAEPSAEVEGVFTQAISPLQPCAGVESPMDGSASTASSVDDGERLWVPPTPEATPVTRWPPSKPSPTPADALAEDPEHPDNFLSPGPAAVLRAQPWLLPLLLAVIAVLAGHLVR